MLEKNGVQKKTKRPEALAKTNAEYRTYASFQPA